MGMARGRRVSDETIRLPDGRRLAYREYGAADGPVVVNCHGGLLTGRDVAPFDEPARAAGIRIVSPDRPGIGASPAAPGRTTADWAADVRALLDGLGVDRAAVLGWSMGGQYALACAALIPERVERAVVVAGALPIDDPETFAQLNKMDRRLTRLSERREAFARIEFSTLGTVARRAPRLWTRQMTKGLPRGEAEALRGLPDPGFASAAAAALHHGHGMVEEYRAWARPWGFRPEAVDRPTGVWQGDADTLIPRHWGERLAARIPGARLSMLPREGHYLALSHRAEILHDLVGDLPGIRQD
jgi:pimeloyl-ACP methyl ester carboxylesterase